jgi:Tol biopolymer transport system component
VRIPQCGFWLTVLMLSIFSTTPSGTPGAQGPTVKSLLRTPGVLPTNLEADPIFRPFLEKMYRSSATFKRQCRRLAAATSLRVRVLVEDEPRPSRSFSARSVLTRLAGSLAHADVFVKTSPDTIEHIAHELEHILELLDGVNLTAHIDTRLVWKSGDNIFETQRAIDAGRHVAREVSTGPTLNEGRDRPPAIDDGRVATVVLQDRDAMPSWTRPGRTTGDGRHVVFISSARLVESDGNDVQDVYVLDRASGRITLESTGTDGTPSNGWSNNPDISGDGRFVVFESVAGNLIQPEFAAGTAQVFLRDRLQGLTRLLTSRADGGPADGWSRNPAISADGATVVLDSAAVDLVHAGSRLRTSPGIFLIRTVSGSRSRVDLSSTGDAGVGPSMTPSVSADGRFVAFVSKADLTCAARAICADEPPDGNGIGDIYVRDTLANSTKRITRSHTGGDTNGPSYHPAISGDGRHVAFISEASNLTRQATNRVALVYVVDLHAGVTEIVSLAPGGRLANGASARPAVSRDGSRVAFQSLASNLVCERKCRAEESDTNLLWDVFVRDRTTRRTIRSSRDVDEDWMENSRAPSLDDMGCVLTFGSRHPTDERDLAHDEDLFVVTVCHGPEGVPPRHRVMRP